jgi:hypothetical protein
MKQKLKRILKSFYFKVIAISLLVTMVAIGAANATIAFFIDSKEYSGTFTAGNVYIEMTEAAVTRDSFGNLVKDETRARISAADTTEGGAPAVQDYGVIHPGQTIYKDPTVKNTGDWDAWIAVKVIVSDGIGDIHKLFGYNEFYEDIDIEGFLSGGLLDQQVHVGDWNGNEFVCYNENYAMVQLPDRHKGVYEFYFFMLDPLKKGESVQIFDTFFVDDTFGNTEMLQFKELEITIQAYAVQTHSLESCYEAMLEAFDNKFGNLAPIPDDSGPDAPDPDVPSGPSGPK